MTIELLYTSAAQGLKQGSRGFCTVVSTAGLPINLAQRLEALSGYRHLYQPGDPRADDNPICHSHIRLVVGGKTLSILSRVSAYGVDYSQRTNKIAHHVVFDGPVPSCGPASVLLEPGIMRTNWDGECKTLQSGPVVPSLSLKPLPCNEWQRVTGDAGWAGVVANAWLQPISKPVWIVFSESQSAVLLALMQEAIAILPEQKRWQATFSTYCTNLPPDVECRVRCVILGSDEARMSIARGLVVDLTKPIQKAVDSPATRAARTGQVIGGETVSQAIPKATAEVRAPKNGRELEEISAIICESTEREYQVDGLSSVPPAFSPPSSYQTTRKQSNERIETSSLGRNWTRIAMTAIAVAASLIVGIVSVYYLKWPSQLLSNNETSSKAEPTIQEEDSQSTIKNTSNPENSEQNERDKSAATHSQREDTQKPKTELHLEQKEIDNWPENVPVLKETKVAVISVNNDLGAVVKMVDGDQWFTFNSDTRQICLKVSNGFDHEKTKSLQATFICNEITSTIQVAVQNVNEPTLTLAILANDNSPLKYVVAGQTLSVKTSGYSDESLQNTAPSFQWKGLTAGIWRDIEDAKSVSYTIPADCNFGKIKCCASDKSVSDTVESNEIDLCPLGEVAIDIDELLRFAADADKSADNPIFPRMRIRLAFPELAPTKRGMDHRFEFVGLEGAIVESQILEIAFEQSQQPRGVQYKFPAKLFQSPVAQPTLEYMESQIAKLINASMACTAGHREFSGVIKDINADGEVLAILKEFFGSMNFPQSIGQLKDVASFFDDINKLLLAHKNANIGLDINFGAIENMIEELQKFAEQSKEESVKENLRKLIEVRDLSERFRTFDKAFPDFIKPKLKNKDDVRSNPLEEIKLLGLGLQKSQNKSQKLRDAWLKLISTTSDLKLAIDSMNELELTLIAKSNASVWVAEKNPDPALRKKNRIDPISVPLCFKLRITQAKGLSVTNSSSVKRDSNGSTSSRDKKKPTGKMSAKPTEKP